MSAATTKHASTLTLATHEAGHAVVAAALGLHIDRLSIAEDAGAVNIRWRPDADGARRYLISLTAGDVAERIFLPREYRGLFGHERRHDWGADGRTQDELCNRLQAIDSGNGRERERRAEDIAEQILRLNNAALLRVRDALYFGLVVRPDGDELKLVKSFDMPTF